METIKLSRIVMKYSPELYPFLKKAELESHIVLRGGIESLQTEDVLEIIQYSIEEHQKHSYLH